MPPPLRSTIANSSPSFYIEDIRPWQIMVGSAYRYWHRREIYSTNVVNLRNIEIVATLILLIYQQYQGNVKRKIRGLLCEAIPDKIVVTGVIRR